MRGFKSQLREIIFSDEYPNYNIDFNVEIFYFIYSTLLSVLDNFPCSSSSQTFFSLLIMP